MTSVAYNSKGAEEPPAKFDAELGSALYRPLPDLVPELVSRVQAQRVYDRMAKTDAVSSVSLRAAKIPILAADFYIDPVGEDKLAEDIASFVEYNLFENISSPWPYVLTRILKMFQHGSSVIETVYENGTWSPNRTRANKKNYTLLKKLAYRPGPTIKKMDYDDNGGPKLIYQQALRGDGKSEEVVIPIEKAIVFQLGDSDDYFGDSILRTAYPHWYYKTHLYKIDAIQKERHGIGIPMGTLPPGFRQSDKDTMNELLRNLRTNERAEMTLPPGYQVEFADVKGQLVNVLESASQHDALIMLNVFAEFLMLGIMPGGGGGRATSGSQTDLFYKSVWFIAECVCDYINMFLIPKLVLYNFETDILPLMKIRNIGQSRDMQQLAAALGNLFHNEIITPDIETEDWARSQFDMPKKKGDRPAPEQTTTVDPTTNGKPTVDISASGGQGNTTKGPQQG